MHDSGFAIIDAPAGASGDMLLGALVSCGVPEEALTSLPGRLGLTGVQVVVSEADRAGVRASRVTVHTPDGPAVGDGDRHAAGAHPHRHLRDLLAVIDRSPLSPWVRERAAATFALLGEAEARVHGGAPENVSLHEVGALDALIDIVGTFEGFERLGIERVFVWPVALGSGWVRASHGSLPVPAPATALLLEGLPIRNNGPVEGEAVTPTGAALLRVLASGEPPERWTLRASGWGAGHRNPTGYANALRLILAEPAPDGADMIEVVADLDDMTPEYLDPLRDALSRAGAVDVHLWPTHMKKGRPGFRVEALGPPESEAGMAEAFFRHSTTAGVRRRLVHRRTLTRRTLEVPAEGGTIRVKVLDGPDGPRVKPEYDDVMAAAGSSGRPALEIVSEARDAAIRRITRRMDPATAPKE